eukprot:XP_003730709.1 PREDICTED: transcription initiation factor TFIID subunit 11-like [Strongylocentrotus purpuratus]
MEVMPATLLATTPFSQAPARITLSAIERTVTSIRYKKQSRASTSTSTKRRSVANQNHRDEPERQPRQQKNYHGNQTQSEQYRHRRRVSSLERRADFRPLGRVSEKQLEMLMKSANEVMEEMRKDAGIVSPPKQCTAPTGTREDLQLPKIAEPKPNETSSPKSSRSSPADNRKVSGDEEDSAKQRSRADAIPRVGGKVYSRVDMVKNLQKHRKSLSAPDRTKTNKTTATKSERRQRCSTSKVESVSWGDSEGMVKGKGSVKGATSTASPSGSDDDAKTKHVTNQEKLPPAKEKKRTKENEVTVRPTKSAFVRLPRVENDHNDAEVDLSTATLEDVILARLEEDDNDADNDSNSCNSKEDRVRWEGNEGGYSSESIACTTRPTSSEADERQTMTTTRSEIATPELSEGALSNDEGDRCVSSVKSRRKTMKHSSAMLKDMNGNLSNKDNTYGDDIAEAIMKKLQPAHPHVIWPDNRFMTSNTVFVYGSPSQLAPVIVPSHSLDCPLCNFYKRSSSGGVCPPNSPTPLLKKDYGFYPVERFYSDL